MRRKQERQFTLGELARAAGIPSHRARYLLDTRQIEPIGRFGVLRVYGPEELERLKAEVASMRRRQPSVCA